MQVSLTPTEMAALAAINGKPLSCSGLAEELKISRAKAASIVASLRRKRIPIASRRDEKGWFYSIEVSAPDPALGSLIGIAGAGESNFSESIDEVIADQIEGKSRKLTVKA